DVSCGGLPKRLPRASPAEGERKGLLLDSGRYYPVIHALVPSIFLPHSGRSHSRLALEDGGRPGVKNALPGPIDRMDADADKMRREGWTCAGQPLPPPNPP